MPRMRIELTSTRDDGAWTWRAAGARQPRGSIDRALLPEGATVGDVLRVEVDQFMDGIEVTSVLHDQEERTAPETLEIIGSGRSEPLVTTKLAGRRARRDGDRSGGRRDGDRRGRPDGDRRQRRDGRADDEGRGASRRGGQTGRRPRKAPTADAKPRARRLRPRRTHRKAAIADLPEDQRHFIELNAELAQVWPVISEMGSPLPEAEQWNDQANKLQFLER